MPTPSTFSIVAYDPTDDAFGVAVASKFLAVGVVVPFAKAGVGAIATPAHTHIRARFSESQAHVPKVWQPKQKPSPNRAR